MLWLCLCHMTDAACTTGTGGGRAARPGEKQGVDSTTTEPQSGTVHTSTQRKSEAGHQSTVDVLVLRRVAPRHILKVSDAQTIFL